MRAPMQRLWMGGLIGVCLWAAACSQEGGGDTRGAGAPALSDPSSAAVEVIEKRYTAAEEASAVTGDIGVSETYRMEGGGETVLTVTGENGLTIEARLVDAISPEATVAGQTLRNLMALAEDARPSHYQISAVRGGSVCGEAQASGLVLFETTGSPPEELTLLVTSGATPGQTGATLCHVLRYTRSGA